jgi:hypothetical protein
MQPRFTLRLRRFAVPFAAGLLLGCMAGSQPIPAQPPAGSPSPSYGAPLILDRTDLRLGTTVHFSRIPDPVELHDLEQVPGLAQVALALESWPSSYQQIQVLDRTPQESELIVIVRGYPPTREATEAWNLLGTRLRLVVLVDGPPQTPAVLSDLNAMRGLERVIAQMDQPSRSGFERLQRPLSFRKVMR